MSPGFPREFLGASITLLTASVNHSFSSISGDYLFSEVFCRTSLKLTGGSLNDVLKGTGPSDSSGEEQHSLNDHEFYECLDISNEELFF